MALRRQHDLAESLRRLRRLANLTQAELARRVGVPQPRVAEWEAGTSVPNPEHYKGLMAELAKALPSQLAAIEGDLAGMEKDAPPRTRKRRPMTERWRQQLAAARELLSSPEVREKFRAIERRRDKRGRYVPLRGGHDDT
jgi:transcriptional regulator with XRE-family HTH domain